MGLYSFHLFAGAGGGILGDILLGHTPIGAVEIEEYPRKVLLQRQRDGVLPPFPIWNDVQTFRLDNPETGPYIRRLKEVAQELVVAGGFP
jgi:site-specific DNA-cytosine methylase